MLSYVCPAPLNAVGAVYVKRITEFRYIPTGQLFFTDIAGRIRKNNNTYLRKNTRLIHRLKVELARILPTGADSEIITLIFQIPPPAPEVDDDDAGFDGGGSGDDAGDRGPEPALLQRIDKLALRIDLEILLARIDEEIAWVERRQREWNLRWGR